MVKPQPNISCFDLGYMHYLGGCDYLTRDSATEDQEKEFLAGWNAARKDAESKNQYEQESS